MEFPLTYTSSRLFDHIQCLLVQHLNSDLFLSLFEQIIQSCGEVHLDCIGKHLLSSLEKCHYSINNLKVWFHVSHECIFNMRESFLNLSSNFPEVSVK